MIIAVDNGNYQTKTIHNIFISGITEHSVMPPLADEVIEYAGSYWTLTTDRQPYRRDKTQDESCFALTLFAIARELKYRSITDSEIAINLAVGLPPQHYGTQKEKFRSYFLERSPVSFSHNSKPMRIQFKHVDVFPQAYGAVVSQASIVKGMSRLFVVDIGGYTTDVMLLANGRLDHVCCYSLEMGTITLVNRIMNKVNSLHDMTITDVHIRDVLADKETILPKEVKETIRSEIKVHAAMTLDKLRELQVDLRSTPSIFVGGGSVMLKPYIEASRMAASPNFITDSRANAIGFEILAESADRARKQGGIAV